MKGRRQGRYRQFYQIGAEALGIDSPVLDAEVLSMLDNIIKELDIQGLDLQINSLGCKDCRPGYREALKGFLKDKFPMLCENCQSRMERNPLRVLDCKSRTCKEAVANAPIIPDYLCGHCKEHFDKVKETLKTLKVSFSTTRGLYAGLIITQRPHLSWSQPISAHRIQLQQAGDTTALWRNSAVQRHRASALPLAWSALPF